MSENYDPHQGMHPNFPRQGQDNLTSKHGSPSEMHQAGVDRHISMDTSKSTVACSMK